MKNIILILLLITVVNANETIDINSKIQIAQKENKQLMFFFHIPHCPYCIRMINENFKDKETLKEIEENFIFIDIYKKDKNYEKLAKDLGAVAYPAILFMNKDKKIIHKAIGYRNTNELLSEMKYISTQSYKSMDLESFILKLEFEKDD